VNLLLKYKPASVSELIEGQTLDTFAKTEEMKDLIAQFKTN